MYLLGLLVRSTCDCGRGTGYKSTINASNQGMDAVLVEYKPHGGNWGTPKFLTRLPAEFVVTPQIPGQPGSGHVKVVFIKDNEPFGNYSPAYQVTPF